MSYAARLREKSMNCEFHDSDERILEHIIQINDNKELVRKVLHKKWTLPETLAEMQVLEDTSEQVEAMGRKDSKSVSKVGKRKKEKRRSSNDAKATDTNRTCKYFGKSHPMQKELCPAYGKFCSKCGKPNHVSTVYLSSRETRRRRRKQSSNTKKDIKRATNKSETIGQKAKSDKETILQRHDKVIKSFGKIFDKKNNEEFLVKFFIKPNATPIAQKPHPVPYYQRFWKNFR